MKLVSLTLRNFRCYKEEIKVEIGELTTIIGRNDIGKSSILEAFEVFFNNNIVKLDCGDCSISTEDKTIEITCEFSDLPERLVLDAQAETSLQAEYLLGPNANLHIKKVYKCDGSKPKEDIYILANHPTAIQYHDLLELNNTNLKKRLRDLHIEEADVLMNNNPSLRQAIWRTCPDLQLTNVLIPVSKEDTKRIWEKINEYLPLYALFQSDRTSRDSDAEVQDPMKIAISAALAEPEIQQKLNDVVDAVRQKAIQVATRTHQALVKIDPNLARQLTPEFKADPKWSGVFSLSLSSDEGIPVNKRGSGIRRMILVSFFRAEAERRHEENVEKSIIYAIEEPETSQHPHNQRVLIDSFQDLASENGCQVLLTTHSPGFASYLPFESFRFIHKSDDGKLLIDNGNEETWEAIATTLGVVPDNRVQVLLCVEGPTDVIAFTCLSHALHQKDNTIIDLSTDPRVAFVVLGGGSLKNWVNQQYLKGLNRPEVHIYDRDVPAYADAIRCVNQRNDGSWGVLTQKREIENYLHEDAIYDGLGLMVNINDVDDIPDKFRVLKNWNPNTAKNKLAQFAFPRMTAARIDARDLHGEVENWFRRIGKML